MPTEYENWYFDGDPDRCEREAERWDWIQKNVSSDSNVFDFEPRCSWCRSHHMHNEKTHTLSIRLYDASMERNRKLAEMLDSNEEHPF